MDPTSNAAASGEAALVLTHPPARAAAGAGLLGVAAAVWGVAGQLVLLIVPSRQLAHAGVDGLLSAALAPWQWGLAAAIVASLGFFQGYRGFQRRYSPLVAARAAHLARNATVRHALLAPLHVCGLVHASRRRRATTAVVFAIMPLLAVLVGLLPAPYRAMVEVGVAFGLLWGAVAIAVLSARAAAGRAPAVPLDLPAAPLR